MDGLSARLFLQLSELSPILFSLLFIVDSSVYGLIPETVVLNIVPIQTSEKSSGSLTVLFALDVLAILSLNGIGGITEIANSLHTNKPRVVRVIKSLVLRGYVKRDEESRKYRLGPKVANLSEGYRQNRRLDIVARPTLRQLCETSRNCSASRA